jgi:branched-chain amino acid:cation transporter, LIVCS family
MISYRKIVLTAGFAMFSMFFGSGNLVFPLLTGQLSISSYPAATLGFLLTAVIVPFLGLLGMILYDGNTKDFFSRLGRAPSFILILMILSLLGPFGVVPRCISVAYGGLIVLYPDLSYWGFSLAFCASVLALIWRSNNVVDVIGLLLTPFKLGGLMFLMFVGLYYAQPVLESSVTQSQAFTQGLTKGYHTMDLMAAFFFSSTTVHYLRRHLRAGDGQSTLVRLSLMASFIGAFILAIAYIGFISLGAKYAPELMDVQPESLLAVISRQALGDMALPIVSLTMVVACLATAVILTLLFVEFLHAEVLKNKISEKKAMVITVAMTFGVSLLGFSKICVILGTILEVSYPALIALAITNILHKLTSHDLGAIPFWGVLIGSLLYRILG